MKQITESIPKIDGIGLALGRPAYTDDLAAENALIVKAIRSPHAYARVVSVDSTEAMKIPGVMCVLTHKDVPRVAFTRAGQGFPEPSPKDKFILDEYARYVGDEVAIVAAVDETTLERAMRAIKVEYEVLEPVLDLETALGHKSVIHPEPEAYQMFPIGFEPQKNIAAAYKMEIGNVEKVIAKSDCVIKDQFFTSDQAHVAMEPHTSTTYLDFHGRLNVITSTQTPFHVRRIMAEGLQMDRKNIRVFKPRIGGGFGGKQQLHTEFFCALVTMKTGRPSKYIFTRKEVFESSFSRHPMRIDITIAATKEGRITAFDMDVLSDTGAYGEHALTVFMLAGAKMLPIYNRVDAVRFGGNVVYTNHRPGGAYRGYGAMQGNFAVESAMDMLAEKLGMDAMKLREMNMIKEGETSEIFRVMGEGTEGTAMDIDCCKLDYCVAKAKELVDWDHKIKPKQVAPNKVRAIGGALAMQGSGIPLIDMGSAIIKLNDGGFFNLLIGATDIGTGSDTVLAQIAAEVLNVPTADIIVYSSDTDRTAFDVGAYASSTTYVSGNAVVNAAKNMIIQIKEHAAKKFDVALDRVEFDGKMITVKDSKKKVSLADFSNELNYSAGEDQAQLVASGSYVGHKSPPPYLAGIAEIEVDTETGALSILDYVAVVDCGTPLNPTLARIQVEGGVLQGIGMAVYEDVRYSKTGKMLNNTLMTYKIPTRQEVRKITVDFADSYEATLSLIHI